MSKQNIIFVNRYFYPDISATSQMLSGIAFGLADKGFRVSVICNQYSYQGEQKFKSYENILGVDIYRIPSSNFGRAVLATRSIDFITFYISAFYKLLNVVKANDIVIAKTDPPLISYICYIVCLIKKANLINWFQDIFPDVAEALGVKLPRLVYKILYYARDLTIRNGKKNIVIGELMEEKIAHSLKDKSKIKIIENWVDINLVKEIDRDDINLIDEWGLKNKFIIGYSGNLGRAHDFKLLVDAARKLSQKKDIIFLFIGGGSGKDKLESLSREENLNFIFKPYQPQNMLSHILSIPHVHIVSLKPSLEGLIVPSKIYGILAVSRPFIYLGSKEGEIARLQRKYASGPIFDCEDIYEAIVYHYNNKNSNYYKDKERVRYDISKEKAVSEWETLLNGLPSVD